MKNYNNAGGFDLQSGISQGVGIASNMIMGMSNAKKQREAQEKLAKLSLAQQKELDLKLQETQSETQRLNIMYQTFAVLENNKLVDGRKNKQIVLLSVLGGGVILLVGMALVFNYKKNS